MLAQELKIFEKHHVQVEPVYYENYLSVYPDFAAGKKAEEISTQGVKIFNLAEIQRAFALGNDNTSLYDAGQTQIDFLVRMGTMTKAPDINQILDGSLLK